MCHKYVHLMLWVNFSFNKKKEKKAVNSATVNPGQVAMTTCPTGNVMVSDPFL